MPRPRGLTVYDSPAYKEYITGADGCRWPNEIPFERDEQGRVCLPQGEVFCRMPALPGGNSLCENNTRFSTTTNLKVHIKGFHKAEVFPTRAGGSTAVALINYYADHMRLLKNEKAPGEELVPTPCKIQCTQQMPHIVADTQRHPDVSMMADNLMLANEQGAKTTLAQGADRAYIFAHRLVDLTRRRKIEAT
ncbi:hypothetical protein FALBO_8665 [Fusarium albosuccineum]|uniref:Uncharacterized protein n=1 Tax=Fusarium albosuccineum TaxID=1237068 RepID=A0A8H4L7W9_9HYPO|nr:hypothetical protein FALBO_8665 [Fusarium albosuccineum]